jgi:hypothetical protein
MKRCPQCLFLYPESDVVCDFDQTRLEVVDDAEVDRATSPSQPSRKAIPLIAFIALIFSVIGFAIYYGLQPRAHKTSVTATQVSVPVQPQSLPTPVRVANASPSPTIAPSPSPAPSSKRSSSGVSTEHSRAATDPISTSGPGVGTRQGGNPVILLATGGKIEADEAWRTKDGVWYRRNGMVTLLKRAQVKAIVTR